MIIIEYKEIEKLCTETLKYINNKKYEEILSEDPQKLLVFRLMLNINQRKLANLLNVSQGTIYAIENGKRKKLNIKLIERIVEMINKLEIIADTDTLTKRYSDIANKGKFQGEYAKRMSFRASKERSIRGAVNKKPTNQEKKFIIELDKIGVQYTFNGVVTIENSRKFVVDFIFPSQNNPKVIIEMKELKSKYRKRLQATELAYKAIKMRQHHTNIKMIVVLDGIIENEVKKHT
ncbi:MAG: helix-turn-helix domain-containing protein [Nanoarchaeota archaeon]|nr:helix-turn-helix domain-containing protein [Nanoarchaeota archaeon]MBU4124225.1 helix-turn-helix domain-containing protein [Nanoarchaeota archaeon]